MELSIFDAEKPPRRGAPTYRILKGSIPVAVSAPHAVRQPRCTIGGEAGLHRSEPYTGPLAIQLHRATGAWAIYATRTASVDPNHGHPSSYKRVGLRQLVHGAAPRIVIDLHGTSSSDFAVALGTSPVLRAGSAQLLIDQVRARLEGALGGRVVVDPDGFCANSLGTVAAHCWTVLGVPSVQVEISRAYRHPRHDPAAYVAVFEALERLILDLALAATATRGVAHS